MSIHPNTTKHANLVNAELLTAMISAQLPEAIRMTAFAPIDASLVAHGGDVISVPYFKYIGEAIEFGEGEAINYEQIQTDVRKYTVKKAGQGVKLTDEAMMNSHGNVVAEGLSQIRMAIADKIESDIVDVALQAPLNLNHAINLDMIDSLEDLFEDAPDAIEAQQVDVTGVIFLNPSDARDLRRMAGNEWTRASELGDSILSTGVFGEVLGWQIIRSKRIPAGRAVALKPNALRLFLNRNVMVETDRDITHKVTLMNADCHYSPAIVNETLVATVTAPTGASVKAEVKAKK